jgi:formylglycine-generating enzyme required for sulfatase activity
VIGFADFDTLQGLPSSERVGPLARLARQVVEGDASFLSAAQREARVRAMVALIEEGVGAPRDRVELGEALGLLGDPRLRRPSDEDYWARLDTEEGPVTIGKFPVSNAEYREFVDGGGYQNRAWWSDAGWAWLQGCRDTWPVLAADPGNAVFVVPNQPVVGVSWWEAQAYARAHSARLPRFDERLLVTRGRARRPYPWGSPFGLGNANTREEVLGRPCALGLYVSDATPEGVRDLAGNVAEWCEDEVGEQRFMHPGAWNEPSMAAWAKARALEAPQFRGEGLGFRLARD